MRHNASVSRSLTLILLSLLLTLPSCSRRPQSSVPRREMSAAEYEVLTAWMNARFVGKDHMGKRITKLVIFDTSDSDDTHLLRDENGQPMPWERMAESLRKKEPALQQSALDAFRKT